MTSLVDIRSRYTAPIKEVPTTKRAGLHRPISAESGNLFTQPTVGVDSAATTQELIYEAIKRAIAAAKQSNGRSRPPAPTLWRLVFHFSGLYYLTHATPELMYEAAQRFASLESDYRDSDYRVLSEWAAQKIDEEKDHDRLAWRDIQSLGFNADAVVKTLVPPAAVALVDRFTQYVRDPNPIACVGYSLAVECIALGITEKHIQEVEAELPPGIQARCLRVHSSVGSDVNHVKETIKMVTRLDPEKCARVVKACYETTLLCFSSPKEGYISDEELRNKLEPLKIHNHVW